MNTIRPSQRPGLILLVVLGMLALFSMLAVTYVVFASQSRATSVSLSRRDVRGNKSYKPLFDEAIKQLIRGSTDNTSATYGHSLLGDVYGDRESVIAGSPATIPAARQATLLRIRNVEFIQNNLNTQPLTYFSLQRPMLLGPSVVGTQAFNGHYLRIPLVPFDNTPGYNYNNPNLLPIEHDVLNGRVVTFPEGNGPLSGLSFRIVRYVGRVDPALNPADDFAQNYSITIDLMEADLSQIFAKYDVGTGVLRSLSLAEWANAFPPSTTQTQAGVYLCFNNVDDTSPNLLRDPFGVLLNAVPLNSHGVGVANNGASQFHVIPPGSTPMHAVATGLQPNYRQVETLPGTMNVLGTNTPGLIGDSDEPYDAADYANFFLAHRLENATTPGQIIPSFHRAALINYLVNWKDPATYTPEDLLLTLRRIQGASGRPLSINVITPAGNLVSQPGFTGSNHGAAVGGVTFASTLNINIPNNWNGSWGTPNGLGQFLNWVNWLTAGPWDVDNDSDGLTDSVWVDVGLPLQTSPDGKLLKALVAYYVDDLDSNLDVNATASMAQTGVLPGINNNVPYATQPDGEFARYTFNGGNTSPFFAQGLGYGSAENSFRHLFFRIFGDTPAAAAAFQQFLMARYGRNSLTLDRSPGLGPFVTNNVANMFEGDDAVSQLRMREQRNIFTHATLPGLPLGTHGRVSVALDRLGNPRVWNLDNLWQQSVEEPYESRWLSAAHQDSPINFAEWERLYRIGDSDRMGLPQRLETLFGETPSSAPASNLRHEITPRSSHLRVPLIGTRAVLNPADLTWQPTSFIELVNAILISRNLITTPIQSLDRINYRGFASLFPLEFERGLPLDLNRPLGNGVDDDNDGEMDEPIELANVVQNALYATGQRTSGLTNPQVAEDYIQNQSPLTLDSPAKQPYDVNVSYANPQTLGFYQRNLESRQLLARHLYCLAQLIIPQNYRFPNSDPNLNYTLPLARATKLARAKILAQWAVNVVDYRDADASMTRFPYDPFPFDPKEGGFYAWDSNPRAIDSTDTSLQNLRTVVWGMEQPELLMTESLATHDVRIKRNATVNPPRYDQYRIPQGSLFLEFFCPRLTAQNGNQQAPGVSPALYATQGPLYTANNQVGLDLTRMAPGRPASASVTVPASTPDPGVPPMPVWRVYISGPTPSTVPPPATPLEVYNDPSRKNQLSYQMINANLRYDTSGSPVNGAQERAQNAGFVFDNTQTNPIPEPNPAEARVLVFTPKASFTPSVDNCPGVVDPEAQVFVSETAGAVLTGGQYLVVGPRTTTFFGSRTTAFDNPNSPVNHPNPHRIELVAGWTRMYKTDNSLVNQRANMNNCFTMVASSLTPPAWRSSGNTRLPQGIGLNVSEPLANDSDYYREPTDVVNLMDTATDPQTSEPGFGSQTYDDAYFDYNAGTPGELDPFDDQQTTRGPLQHWRAGNNTNITSDQVVVVGTQQNWCTAYLQRLADPEKAWDATFNPYITVDWIPIDLTVFSGEEAHSDVYPASPPQGQEIRFASRQKTGQPLQRFGPASFAYDFTSQTPPLGTTLYSAATHAPREVTPLGLTTGFFDYELAMDEVAGTAAAPIRPTLVNLLPTTDANHVNNTFATLGFLNSTYRIAGEEGSVATSAVRGLPADPTNGVTANVQPNPNWIPDSFYWANRQFTSPLEMTTVPLSSPGQFMQEFSALDAVGTLSRYEVADSGNAQIPFNHLLPFTYEQSQRPALPATPDIPVSALLSLVETASPWSDAHKYADPRELAYRDPATVPAVVAQNVAASNYVLQPLRAPYNRISRYVEPGRVNINTVAERNVLQGLFFNALQPNERTILNSPTMNNLWTQFQFSRQGYVGGGGAYVSPALPVGSRFNPEVPTEFARPFKPAMESGMVPLTRAAQAGNPNTLDPDGYHTPANATLMRSDPNQNTLPLLRESYPFAQKNAFTDAHPITRLGNLSTERSNVFGVYVTVGLFEYDPGTGVIGQEFGEDKGQAQRYKAFYVIDRSVPVGFQTGVDHNVEKTILLRRYLKTDDR